MKRIILAALVGVLVSGPVVAQEKDNAPPILKIMWIGDGKSFDTAFFFISARSQSEAVLLEYVHLKKNGYESLAQNLVYKDGKRFDVHETERGKVYFRLPSNDGLK
ncbi:MAG: hypothetical protein V3R37_11340 [Rhodospirillales bacterium]